MLWHPQEILITTVDGGMQIFVGELMYANFCSNSPRIGPIQDLQYVYEVAGVNAPHYYVSFFPPFFLLAMRIVSFTCFMMFQRGY